MRLEFPAGPARLEVFGPPGAGLDDALRALLSAPAPWHLWYRSPAAPHLSPATGPLRGAAVCLPDGFGLAFRFPPGLDFLPALRTLEAAAVPVPIIAASLAAVAAPRLPVRLAPWVFARLAGPSRSGPVGEAALRALLLGGRPAWEELLGAARRLLDPRTVAALGGGPGLWDLLLLGAAALELEGVGRLPGPAGPLPVAGAEPEELLGTYAAWAEFVRGGLSPEAFHFFYPQGFRPPALPLAGPLRTEASGPAAALRGVLAAAGPGPLLKRLRRLELKLPFELERLLGGPLRVWADEAGLWVFLPRPGLPVRWEPGGPPGLAAADPGLDLVLAALWHDLRTAGPQAFPGAGSERRWGSFAEYALARQASGVRGHLRRLPRGRRPGRQALRLAAALGLVLPAGYTFVRPHLRAEEPRPKVRARGLVTVLALAACGERRS